MARTNEATRKVRCVVVGTKDIAEPPFHFHNVAGVSFNRQTFAKHPTLKDEVGNAARVPVVGAVATLKASKIAEVKKALATRYLMPLGRGRMQVQIVSAESDVPDDFLPVSTFLRMEPVDDASKNLLEVEEPALASAKK